MVLVLFITSFPFTHCYFWLFQVKDKRSWESDKKEHKRIFFYLARCWKLSSMAGSQRQTPSLKGWFSDLKTSSTLAPWTSAQFRDDVHSCWPPKTPSQLLLSWHTLYSPFLRGSVHPGMKFFGESLSKWGQSRSITFQVLFMTNPQSIQIYKLVLDQPSQAIQTSNCHIQTFLGENQALISMIYFSFSGEPQLSSLKDFSTTLCFNSTTRSDLDFHSSETSSLCEEMPPLHRLNFLGLQYHCRWWLQSWK